MTDPVSTLPDPIPQAPVTERRRWSASLVWLVPVVAALIGISMVVHSWSSEGPLIAIAFSTAEGLEAGKTPVKYKDVVVGTVASIELAPDRSHVVAHVALDKSAQSFATADARFWAVRPRFGATGVSGIGTLLSGTYIAADTGASTRTKREFVGLEKPPAVIYGAPGKRFVLHASDIGSLDVGSPVYYRRIEAGRVVSYELEPDGQHLRVGIFVDAPYDRWVNTSSRFWNASGVDLNLDASGLKLNTQSLATVVAGGLAFQTAPGEQASTPAPEDAEFTLFDDIRTAMAPPDGEAQYFRLRFDQSLRGLNVGAPVDFHGVVIGKVVSIELDYDAATQHFPLVVGAVIYPERFGRANDKFISQVKATDPQSRPTLLLKPLVERGLRAQARSGNLLTGQLYIALDFIPNAPKAVFDDSVQPIELPTAPGGFEELQEQVANVVRRIDRLPLESIGHRLDDVMGSLDSALRQVDTTLLPQVNTTLIGAQGALGSATQTIAGDSPLQQNLAQTLAELQRAARSMRVLTDYLGRNPEALIRGKPADPARAASPRHGTTPGEKP